MITLAQFQQMIPTNREAPIWYSIAKDMFEQYEINTVNRIASFMAQCAHESGDFKILEENLNYSKTNLLATFGKYFGPNKENPDEYVNAPMKLANYVYMDVNRTKSGALGNTQSGDGWRFRGGGIKQLTGRNNFTNFGRSIGKTAEEAADYVRTKQGAFESACWFWKRNNLTRFADADNIDGMSRKVNGGDNGLIDRRTRYLRNKSILASRPVERPIDPIVTYHELSRGARGDLVKRIQTALRILNDGIYGLQTEIAVRSWQRNNKYSANGILNVAQIKQILGEQ